MASKWARRRQDVLGALRGILGRRLRPLGAQHPPQHRGRQVRVRVSGAPLLLCLRLLQREMWTCRPQVLAIDIATSSLATAGGPVNLYVRQLGFGRHAMALNVGMHYGNGNYSYIATGCHMWWNGSYVSCVAPPGVGRNHRWVMYINGFSGLLSPPSVVISYRPPVLYDIFSAVNNTLTTPSQGGEIFNITGVNFGPASENVVWWVHYSPVKHPNITFSATCKLIVDHTTLRCATGPQAGNHLYWTVNVAGTLSQVPFTSTASPNITSVTVLYTGQGLGVDTNGTVTGAAPLLTAKALAAAGSTAYPSLSTDGTTVATSGGGIVLLRGRCVYIIPPSVQCTASSAFPFRRNFGPKSSTTNLTVWLTPTRPLPSGFVPYFVNASGSPSAIPTTYQSAFVCPTCVVTVPHFEITCVVPEGFGGLLAWHVEVLGVTSTPYISSVSYDVPVLSLLPLPVGGYDLFANNSFNFTPYNTLPSVRQHQNLSLLNPFAYVPVTNATHYVTNCDPANASALANATAGIGAIDLASAIAAVSSSGLTWAGYPLPGGGYADYSGGNLFFMVDRATDQFHVGPLCEVWREPLVQVSTDEHWVAFTGHGFVPGFDDAATCRAVIDGAQLPAANLRVRDMELVEVLVPAFLGRRRLQLDVNGVRSNGIVLVNEKPVVQGFMEWRLAVEDIRGPSPRSEDSWRANPDDDDPGWGGFGAWNPSLKCMNLGLVGHHFGSDGNFANGLIQITVDDRVCEEQIDIRHHRLTCCSRYPSPLVTVFVAGQTSESVLFQPAMLTRKPIVLVRLCCWPY